MQAISLTMKTPENTSVPLDQRLTAVVGKWISEDAENRAFVGASLLGEIAKESTRTHFISLETMAERMGLSKSTLYKTWAERGGVKVGGVIRFPA